MAHKENVSKFQRYFYPLTRATTKTIFFELIQSEHINFSSVSLKGPN